MTLLPENANKRIDNLGRITLPKGLRSRLCLETGTEMELYTMAHDGRLYICMTAADSVDPKYYAAKEVLEELGANIPKELLHKIGETDDL